MSPNGNIYVLGCGAVGLTLAAHLASAGRNAIAVRTGNPDVPAGTITITVKNAANPLLDVPVPTISLARLEPLDGVVVVSAKSHANGRIAAALSPKTVTGPLVVMQNGVGVENPFLESAFGQIYRCVLYVSGQSTSRNEVAFRPIASSPIGVIQGDNLCLAQTVALLTTPGFPFHPARDIQADIWKKAVINAVFNSICPLLDADNGIFFRDSEAAGLAAEIISECVVLANAAGVSLTQPEMMAQIMKISQGSDGILISTLQDIRNGRATEIESINVAMARLAGSMNPKIILPKTGLLGRMILAKSNLSMKK